MKSYVPQLWPTNPLQNTNIRKREDEEMDAYSFSRKKEEIQ